MRAFLVVAIVLLFDVLGCGDKQPTTKPLPSPQDTTGNLHVVSTPTGSTVFLDQRLIGLTPVLIDSLAPRSYVLKVLHRGYTAWTSTETVRKGKTTEVTVNLNVACPGDTIGNLNEPPTVHITSTAPGLIKGTAANIDGRHARVVLWALTNQWYIQPYTFDWRTLICGDGTWQNNTHPWNRIVALLVDESFVPEDIRTDHPKNMRGVLAWDEFPRLRNDLPLQFSGRTWDIKLAESPFDPGPNYFSDHPDNVFVDQSGRLHLRIVFRDNKWYCAEVLLPQSLGLGVYTMQVDSPLHALDPYVVVAPEFIYESRTRELDHEAAGEGLIPRPSNAQFVSQPYTTLGNLVRYILPAESQTTFRIEWRSDHVRFTTWIGRGHWPPDSTAVINDWNYTGPNIPPPGGERLHINTWLFNGHAPANGQTAEVILKSFTYEP